MARPREPIDLIIAKGKKHLGAEEIERRRAQEIKVPFTDVEPPEYLKGAQRDEFMEYSKMLEAIGIFTELDVDCLARYVLSHNLYLTYTARLLKTVEDGEVEEISKMQTLQDKVFRQAQACARELGLTISSRCKLTIPEPPENAEDYEL